MLACDRVERDDVRGADVATLEAGVVAVTRACADDRVVDRCARVFGCATFGSASATVADGARRGRVVIAGAVAGVVSTIIVRGRALPLVT
ncbi:MAG: hypothetical protein JWO97_1684 [Acidobacteria bacterium]|nr:hypothetical protein [Acidobacteriota bacterium]